MELPLAMLSEGAKGKITQIFGGKRLVRRLNDMGFTRDAEVKVVCSHSSHSRHHGSSHRYSHGSFHNHRHGGPLVVEVKDSRIAFGRGIASKIMVTEVEK